VAAEQHADGRLSSEKLQRAHQRLTYDGRSTDYRVKPELRPAVWATATGPRFASMAAQRAAELLAHCAVAKPQSPFVGEARARWNERTKERRGQARTEQSHGDVLWTERAAQAGLLRCLAGNLLRPAAPAPDWLTWEGGVAVALAGEIYDERTFELLPVLADLLEDAGCSDAPLLGHCREPGEHARGCWALDLIVDRR
jgi:hypothetical protein